LNPFGDDDEPAENPFAPRREARPTIGADQPRKLQLLGRGLAIFGTYAKVLEADGRPAAYVQFGPLSAYPRAQHLRDLYPRLPATPLPAVITCIATTPEARGAGHAHTLIAAVCDDLAGRGFAAVEAYPERGARADSTSAATPEFWVDCGFTVAIDDERFPVLRREL
jgi:GNAT superfamily N-acetyltransferase